MLFGGIVAVILLALAIRDRRRAGVSLRPRLFVLMLIESAILAGVFGFAVGIVTAQMLNALPPLALAQTDEMAWPVVFMVSLGAGVYEELVFRVLLVSGLLLLAQTLFAMGKGSATAFAVILGVPFGLLGALLGLLLRGLPNDVYFTIGLVTVVGLAAKNAILIVEFAVELRRQGKSLREAAMTAARERFRPILMTSFAFILGVVPLVIASGAGAAARNSLGTGVFGGMLVATIVGVFFIPLFFFVIMGLSERLSKKESKAPALESVKSEG